MVCNRSRVMSVSKPGRLTTDVSVGKKMTDTYLVNRSLLHLSKRVLDILGAPVFFR